MSLLRLFKVAKPSNPAANSSRTYYDTAGPGFNTPAALCAVDESGNQAMLAHFTVLDYRFLKVSEFKASGTWTPANGCRLAFVECWGAGGQGGGCATSSSTSSCGSGGGGGSYAASTLTGAAIKSTAYSVGAKGSGGSAGANGNVGGDTTWDTTVIVAKGGSGGILLAAGSTVINQVGGAGGLASGSTGDIKRDGSIGGSGLRFSITIALGGEGGAAANQGVVGAGMVASPTGGTAGVTANTAAVGSGGGGAATITTQQAGGSGADGMVRIWEYA